MKKKLYYWRNDLRFEPFEKTERERRNRNMERIRSRGFDAKMQNSTENKYKTRGAIGMAVHRAGEVDRDV